MANFRSAASGVLLSLVALAGCAGSDRASSGDQREYEVIGRQFGQHIVGGDWAAAYGMTTGEFQQAVSLDQLQASYHDLVRQMREDEPDFEANTIQIDFGELPGNEQEARETFDIVVVPPQKSWKAWIATGIGSGDGTTIRRGVDAWLLLVEQAGQLKIGHVNFEFID